MLLLDDDVRYSEINTYRWTDPPLTDFHPAMMLVMYVIVTDKDRIERGARG